MYLISFPEPVYIVSLPGPRATKLKLFQLEWMRTRKSLRQITEPLKPVAKRVNRRSRQGPAGEEGGRHGTRGASLILIAVLQPLDDDVFVVSNYKYLWAPQTSRQAAADAPKWSWSWSPKILREREMNRAKFKAAFYGVLSI